MPLIPRKTILERFHRMIADGVPIIGGGAGTGLSAKSEEAGGIDLIIIYNSGRYRMAGRGSAAGLLAYGNANEIVKEMAVEVLPVVKQTPVLAGVNGTDPFVLMPRFLAELKDMGFSGVQNFPTIGLFDGTMRQSFEETGMGFGLEVDMIAAAHDLDLLTTPYVFNPDEAKAMTKAGADIVVAHMGVTTGGTIGATNAKSLDDCVAEIDGDRRCGAFGAQGCDPALPWRADLDARRRALRAGARRGPARLLRRFEHGAPAGGAGDRQADGGFQGTLDSRQGSQPGTGQKGISMSQSDKMFRYPRDVNTFAFDWGRLALTVAPEVNGAERFSGGVVDLRAGAGPCAPQPSRSGGDHFRDLRHWRADGRGRGRKPGRAKGRTGLHDLRAGKPLSLDAEHRRRTDAIVRRLFAGRPGGGVARSAGFPAGAARRTIGIAPKVVTEFSAGSDASMSGRRPRAVNRP